MAVGKVRLMLSEPTTLESAGSKWSDHSRKCSQPSVGSEKPLRYVLRQAQAEKRSISRFAGEHVWLFHGMLLTHSL